MNSHIKTYARGYDLFFTRNITKGDMVNICNDLTNEFDNCQHVCKNENYLSLRYIDSYTATSVLRYFSTLDS